MTEAPIRRKEKPEHVTITGAERSTELWIKHQIIHPLEVQKKDCPSIAFPGILGKVLVVVVVVVYYYISAYPEGIFEQMNLKLIRG